MVAEQKENNPQAIAIIGMAGRFPKSKDLEAFWQNLKNGVELVSTFTDEELLAEGMPAELLQNPSYVKAKAVLEDSDMFDASFFGFSPREAEVIDPQHRLFLETAWAALENAGYDSERYPDPIGVYAGLSMNTYFINNLLANHDVLDAVGYYQVMLANDKDFIATRTAYKLDLKGPAINVQSACSSSLVAVQLACQSLLNYQSDMALAGGVAAGYPHKSGYLYQPGMIFSPDGHCRPFDAKAQGIIAGEGVGIVVLKRLQEAIDDGDTIHAVIRGTAVNNDGALKVGYTAPSVSGQAEVIATAQALAGVDPRSIGYIEAHGTGTDLGDPIEVSALTQVFRASTQDANFCGLGSVKSNMGHLDAAAGVAGLIKTVLAFKHRQLPPNLHFESPNPKLDLPNSPFFVNAELQDWEANGIPRRAGVSSFGIGGTNVHIVLEEAPPETDASPTRPHQLLMLSAKTKNALHASMRTLASHIQDYPESNLADMAYTLQVGRREFTHRAMLVTDDAGNAVKVLESGDPRRLFTGQVQTNDTPVVFMFTGQGSQYVDMGRGLYESESVFRQQIDHCAEILQPHLGLDIRQIIFPDEDKAEAAANQLIETAITQPALFTVEYALAKLWMSWGIQPARMIGHSIGEYVAACLAGVFSLEDGLRLVSTRGRLMQSLPAGSMLSLQLSEASLLPLLGEDVSLAAVNAPDLCVVSGTAEAIDSLQNQLEEQQIACRRLHTSHAFHSAMMDPILQPFAEIVGEMSLRPPDIPFISNVTGEPITSAQATDPQYWAQHLRSGVRFSQGVRYLQNDMNSIFLEVGPGQTLSTLAKMHKDGSSPLRALSSIRHPHDPSQDTAFLMNALGQLWLAGAAIDWNGFYAEEKRRRIPLPTYPFERKHFSVEPRPQTMLPSPETQIKTKRANLDEWFYLPSWKRKPLTVAALQETNDTESRNWLVFVDDTPLTSRFVERVREKGDHLIEVRTGDDYQLLADDLYCINPNNPQDYISLVRDLQTARLVPDHIVHMWTVTDGSADPSDPDTIQTSLDLGLFSLLYLVQAFGETMVSNPMRWLVISNQVHEVTANELTNAAKATVLSPIYYIPIEYRHIRCRSIDIQRDGRDANDDDWLAEQFIRELSSDFEDLIIAYRGPHRWVRTWEPEPFPASLPDPAVLKKGGTYLITGGLGGIGMALAQYLAREFQAKIALTTRSAFPAREQWETLLADLDPQDPVHRRILAIRELEDQGADMLVLQADVTNRAEMEAAVEQVHQTFSKIDGAIHAAGIAGGGMMQFLTKDAIQTILDPKIQGSLILDSVLQNSEPDFIVFCSSTDTIVPGALQLDYSAANLFLDAYSQQKNLRKGTHYLTINWDTWQEVGMAVDTVVPVQLQAIKDDNLRNGIRNEEGQEVFRRALSAGIPQIAVSTRDLNWLLKMVRTLIDTDISSSLDLETIAAGLGAKPSSNGARPDLAAEYEAPIGELEQQITQVWQNLLGIDPIGRDDNFFELGGHSLLATQVLARLNAKFDVELPLRSLFEAPTIAELAQRIDTLLWALQSSQIIPESTGDDREELEF